MGAGHDVGEVAVGRDDPVLELVLPGCRVHAKGHADDQGQDDRGQEEPGGDPHAVPEFGIDEGAVGAAAPVPAGHDAGEPLDVALPRVEVRVQALQAHGVGHLLGGGAGNAFLFQQRRFEGADRQEISGGGGQEDHDHVGDAALGKVPEHGTLLLLRRHVLLDGRTLPGASRCAGMRGKTTITCWILPSSPAERGLLPRHRVRVPAGSWLPQPLRAGPGGLCCGSHSRGNYHSRRPEMRRQCPKATRPYQIVMNNSVKFM